MRRIANNVTVWAALNYSIVDDLAQSPTTMSTLEVLKNFPSQRKALLFSLGVIDPFDSRLITFDLDQGEPRMPPTFFFQIPVSIWNLVVHQCIIDEGASTCLMSTFVWKKIGSPNLQPALCAYDGHSTKA